MSSIVGALAKTIIWPAPLPILHAPGIKRRRMKRLMRLLRAIYARLSGSSRARLPSLRGGPELGPDMPTPTTTSLLDNLYRDVYSTDSYRIGPADDVWQRE